MVAATPRRGRARLGARRGGHADPAQHSTCCSRGPSGTILSAMPGIAASTGSACHTVGSPPSAILIVLGYPLDVALGTPCGFRSAGEPTSRRSIGRGISWLRASPRSRGRAADPRVGKLGVRRRDRHVYGPDRGRLTVGGCRVRMRAPGPAGAIIRPPRQMLAHPISATPDPSGLATCATSPSGLG